MTKWKCRRQQWLFHPPEASTVKVCPNILQYVAEARHFSAVCTFKLCCQGSAWMCFYHPNKMTQHIVVPLHFFLYVQQIHIIHHALFAMLNVSSSSSSSRQNRWYVVNSINTKYIECVRVDFSFQPSKLCRVIRGIRANLHWHLHTAETTNTHIIFIWCRQ